MLTRPQPDRERRREQQRRWQREYRCGLRQGVKRIEATRPVTELLIEAKWLAPEDAADGHAISDALDAFARDALKTFR